MRSRLRYVAETTGMAGPAASVSRRRRGRRRAAQVAGVIAAASVQGTVNVGDRRYRTGQPVLVIYDPEHPGVVGLAGDIGDKSSAWAEIVIGGLFVALIPACYLLSLFTARRRHRRAVRAVLGG